MAQRRSINLETFQRRDMSMEAKAMLIYLWTIQQEGWDLAEVTTKDRTGWGSHKTKMALQELRALGYLVSIPIRGSKGRYSDSITVLKDEIEVA